MPTKIDARVVVVIPNWNGESDLPTCLDSLMAQSLKPSVIMVDNGSKDSSIQLVESKYPDVEIIRNPVNMGYTGGVNPGYQRALELSVAYVAPFNNDAVADHNWLRNLVDYLDEHPKVGIASCKVASSDGKHLDDTGDLYTIWGLPYPRGRGEVNTGRYDSSTEIFGGSGAASLYRVSMLEEIGLLDQDFFAYYEDVDISFRAQLAGWKIAYVPRSVIYHATSTTGSRVKGLFTYQTVKNYPWLLIKNVPGPLLPKVLPRFLLAQFFFVGRAVLRGHGWYALKAIAVSLWKLPKKLSERRHIQKNRKVSSDYIWSIMTHDLPPNAHNLRKLRAMWWRLTGRKTI